MKNTFNISGLDANDPQRPARVVRAHWAIENNLHWVLDIAFDEDSNRTRNGHSAANLAVIRHIALNLIKAEKTAKVGVKIKQLKAGWDNNYLLHILGLTQLDCLLILSSCLSQLNTIANLSSLKSNSRSPSAFKQMVNVINNPATQPCTEFNR